MKKEDSLRSDEDWATISKEAEKLLRKAGVWGQIPTNVPAVIDAANLIVDDEVSLDSRFLKSLYRRSVDVLKRAVNKVLAVIDLTDRRIYIDQSEHKMRKKFVSLHDTAHYFLKWQRKAYKFAEECELSISPEIQEAFECEANAFASDVLFQATAFTRDAADSSFGLDTITDLAKRYDASIYSSMRRYVRSSDRACAVLVYNMPLYIVGVGRTMELRRVEVSKRFQALFNSVKWPLVCNETHFLLQMCPSRWRSRPRIWRIKGCDGKTYGCAIEALNTTRQVFFLVCPEAELGKRRLRIAG